MPLCADAVGERSLMDFSQRLGGRSERCEDAASDQSPAKDKRSLSLNLNLTSKLSSLREARRGGWLVPPRVMVPRGCLRFPCWVEVSPVPTMWLPLCS